MQPVSGWRRILVPECDQWFKLSLDGYIVAWLDGYVILVGCLGAGGTMP